MNDDYDASIPMLPRDEPPPASLEDQVVTRLRAQGAFRQPVRRRLLTALAVAAALCIGFLGGLLVPRETAAQVPAGRAFVLLLYRGAETDRSPAEVQRRVDEYRRWAGTLRARNALLAGEKLKDGATILGHGAVADPVAGYFVITARDAADAERIARECPHLRYGGWIEVREIEKT